VEQAFQPAAKQAQEIRGSRSPSVLRSKKGNGITNHHHCLFYTFISPLQLHGPRQEQILTEIGVIGAGNMGAALVRGLVRSGKAMPEMITVFDTDASKAESLQSELGIRRAATMEDAVSPETTAVILAVKPLIMGDVLDSIADSVHSELVLISIAAGISTSFILSHLGGPARVIRVMPNAAAMVGESASALCMGGVADDSDMELALGMFSAVGTAVVVDEKMMNAVTGLSGSGPGYLFLVMEAMTDGAVMMGLDRLTARALTVQTLMGAAKMAAAGNISFSELKDRITSPGGTTIAGLQVLERSGLRGVFMEAIAAATKRAQQLDSAK
jgi:pyrroline-5-carboxylate reductase